MVWHLTQTYLRLDELVRTTEEGGHVITRLSVPEVLGYFYKQPGLR
jgi:hypothetical protein